MADKVSDALRKTRLFSTNNYPLRQYDDLSQLGSANSGIPQSVVQSEFYSKLNNITYETLAQNLQSYPYTVDMNDKKLINRTYTTGPKTTVNLEIDMRNADRIICTLTGDVPTGVKLVKTTFIDPVNNKFTTTYS